MPEKIEKKHPAQLELMILKLLWSAEEDGALPLAVRDVREGLKQFGRDLAHTTVITTLNIMVDKKFVKRSKRKNAFYFSPRVQRESVQSRAIDDVLNRVFDGSAKNLMLSLLENTDVTATELTEIKNLIRQKSKKPSE